MGISMHCLRLTEKCNSVVVRLRRRYMSACIVRTRPAARGAILVRSPRPTFSHWRGGRSQPDESESAACAPAPLTLTARRWPTALPAPPAQRPTQRLTPSCLPLQRPSATSTFNLNCDLYLVHCTQHNPFYNNIKQLTL